MAVRVERPRSSSDSASCTRSSSSGLAPSSPTTPSSQVRLSFRGPAWADHEPARLPTLLPLNVQARPIVVDSLVRMPLSAKLITNSDGRNSQPISKPPLVIHAAAEDAAQRVAELEAHGVQCHVGKYSEGKRMSCHI